MIVSLVVVSPASSSKVVNVIDPAVALLSTIDGVPVPDCDSIFKVSIVTSLPSISKIGLVFPNVVLFGETTMVPPVASKFVPGFNVPFTTLRTAVTVPSYVIVPVPNKSKPPCVNPESFVKLTDKV